MIIGSNIGTAILAKSGNEVVFNGTVRDLRDLEAMPSFTSFIRGDYPYHQTEMMLKGLNAAIRIGPAIVLTGDIVLGYFDGVTFIPLHLGKKVIKAGKLILARDEFGQIRLKEDTYTL